MSDRFPRKFNAQTSYKPLNYVLGLIFVVNIKFPQATYHMIVPSTEELYCLIRIKLASYLGTIRVGSSQCVLKTHSNGLTLKTIFKLNCVSTPKLLEPL